jgi:hypothetical protein
MAVRDQVTINDALEAFLVEQRGRLAAKTLRRYEDVVWLLRECRGSWHNRALTSPTITPGASQMLPRLVNQSSCQRWLSAARTHTEPKCVPAENHGSGRLGTTKEQRGRTERNRRLGSTRRVLSPRPASATEHQLPEGVTCDAALWAACVGGAMQRDAYRQGIEAAASRSTPGGRTPSTASSPSAPTTRGVTSISSLARRR